MATASLHAEGVAYGYAASVPVLSGVSFRLPAGWTGIVGANGAGKSTLLRLLTGSLAPTEGAVRIAPEGATVALCVQELAQVDASVADFAASEEALHLRLRARLGLEGDELARWSTLSPGERRRWQVGAALAAEPDVLCLDEPTNHLDAGARRWLEGALAVHRGIGLLVSHDRALLDAVTVRTVRLHDGAATLYEGGYSVARATWEGAREARVRAREKAVANVARLETHLADARARRADTERSRSTRTRMKGPRDSDARGILATNKAAWADARAGQDVTRASSTLVRARGEVGAYEVDRTLGRRVFAEYARAPGARLVALDTEELCTGDHVVLRDVHLVLDRESRIHVTGANGAGKSTLLAALLAAFRGDPARLCHVPQHLSRAEGARLLDAVRALPPAARGRTLSLVSALGVDPGRLLRSGDPSPGEARKLALAEGLGREAWAVVLDEPTNDLDLPSIERLGDALAAFPGALLLVSHDEALARATTTTRWVVAEGRVRVG